MTNIKMGDEVLCISNKELEDTGLRVGVRYTANQVLNIPGQGEYVGVYVDSIGQIVVVDAARFEKAYTLNYRIFHDTMTYALMDETFDEEDHKDKGSTYVDISITLPESQLENVEDVLNRAVTELTMKEKENETVN